LIRRFRPVLLVERLGEVVGIAQHHVLAVRRHLHLVVRHGEQLVAHAEHASHGDDYLRDAARLRVLEHEVLHSADFLPLRVANLRTDDLGRAMRALPRVVGHLRLLAFRLLLSLAARIGGRRALREYRRQGERKARGNCRRHERCSVTFHDGPLLR